MSTEKDKKLKDCISNSVKKREKEKKEQLKNDEKERKEKLKVIKHFFKQILPRGKEFTFKPVQAPLKKIQVKKKLLTGEIKIYKITDFPRYIFLRDPIYNFDIETWNYNEIRWMYDNLPWFEAELRREFGCK